MKRKICYRCGAKRDASDGFDTAGVNTGPIWICWVCWWVSHKPKGAKK